MRYPENFSILAQCLGCDTDTDTERARQVYWTCVMPAQGMYLVYMDLGHYQHYKLLA